MSWIWVCKCHHLTVGIHQWIQSHHVCLVHTSPMRESVLNKWKGSRQRWPSLCPLEIQSSSRASLGYNLPYLKYVIYCKNYMQGQAKHLLWIWSAARIVSHGRLRLFVHKNGKKIVRLGQMRGRRCILKWWEKNIINKKYVKNVNPSPLQLRICHKPEP